MLIVLRVLLLVHFSFTSPWQRIHHVITTTPYHPLNPSPCLIISISPIIPHRLSEIIAIRSALSIWRHFMALPTSVDATSPTTSNSQRWNPTTSCYNPLGCWYHDIIRLYMCHVWYVASSYITITLPRMVENRVYPHPKGAPPQTKRTNEIISQSQLGR